MKKIISLAFLITIVFALSLCVSAKSGDIAGVYYSTDINTFLNGEEIDSINIGGQTLISAEDMYYYGFSVTWFEQTRELRIISVEHAQNGAPPHIKKSNYPSGMVLGNYYETDIKTYLNGEIITAYNIGGRTYIHAEETKNFGFDVEWAEADRNLFLTSPEFAGHEYSFKLNEEKPQSKEGIGAFSINYTKDSVYTSGDFDYFTGSFHSTDNNYYIILGFYQNGGLFYSGKLLDTLSSLESGNNALPVHNEEEKYDLVNENIKIMINNHLAKEVAVAGYRGNGHRTYYLYINDDIPKYTEDEIESLYISVGDVTNLESVKTELPKIENSALDIAEGLLKNPLDWIKTYYETDDYLAVNLKQSPRLGVVIDRLYIINKATGECSPDILDEVRQIDGFNYDKIELYAMSVKAVKNNLFFSCALEDRTGDFYVELDSAKVHFIAQSAR